MTKKKDKIEFKLPWTKHYVSDGKCEYYRLKIDDLMFEIAIDIKDKSIFYLLGLNPVKTPTSILEAEQLVIDCMKLRWVELKEKQNNLEKVIFAWVNK